MQNCNETRRVVGQSVKKHERKIEGESESDNDCHFPSHFHSHHVPVAANFGGRCSRHTDVPTLLLGLGGAPDVSVA